VRYLVLTPDFAPAYGGVQTLVAGLAAGLARHNDVVVVAPAAEGDAAFDAGVPYRVHRYRSGRSRFDRVAGLFLAAVREVEDCDVILCGHIAGAPVAYLLNAASRKPYFIYVHGMEVTPDRYRRLWGTLLRHAMGVFTGSDYGRHLVTTYFNIPAAKITVIPPAVSATLVRAAGAGSYPLTIRRPGERVLLSVARLAAGERYKGHDVVIRALPLIRRCVPACVYWVVGDGDDAGRLRELARELGVADGVKFWGRVGDVAPFYRECDVFILPGRRIVESGAEKAEGFGLVFLEAGLFKKPVVAGRCAGALDAVVDGETGVLVDPENVAEIAAVVVGLLNHPGEASRMGAAAKQRVLREFTLVRQVARFEAAVGVKATAAPGGLEERYAEG
jgi:phosphatidylinositol alpha-1,6-mannosyltransferase